MEEATKQFNDHYVSRVVTKNPNQSIQQKLSSDPTLKFQEMGNNGARGPASRGSAYTIFSESSPSRTNRVPSESKKSPNLLNSSREPVVENPNEASNLLNSSNNPSTGMVSSSTSSSAPPSKTRSSSSKKPPPKQ